MSPLTSPPAPRRLVLAEPWRSETLASGRRRATFRVVGRGEEAEVTVERCVAGRLRDAYPAGSHDLEVTAPAPSSPDLLAAVAAGLLESDTSCRRVVIAREVSDEAGVEALAGAGFRPVTEVDVGAESLSLLVAEPEWVTVVDMDIDRVPTT